MEEENLNHDSNAAEQEKNVTDGDNEYREKYLYLLAEFDNYRKTLDKQLIESERLIREKIIFDMIKVLDDFDNVMKNNKDKDIEALMKSIYSVLKSYGLTKMDIVGKDYSPDIAEAIATESIKEEAGKIIEEIQTGYKLNDRIIRYPKVKIAI
jgi:molecular chaperone GrpE